MEGAAGILVIVMTVLFALFVVVAVALLFVALRLTKQIRKTSEHSRDSAVRASDNVKQLLKGKATLSALRTFRKKQKS